MKRKAIQLASNTLVVSLPSEWVKKTKLKKGDELEVDEMQGKLILSSQKTSTVGRVEIDVSDMHPMIKRMLGALYKSGYDEVKVNFSSIEELKTVQEVVREEFLGFEVVDQKKNWLVYKKVSSIDTKEFNTMLRRMFLIITSMADDSLEAIMKSDKDWLEVIVLHDKDVNKISDFCRRIVNTAGVEEYKQNAPVYFMLEQLEKIGDMYRDICRHSAKNSLKPSPQLQAIYKETNLFFRRFYEIFFSFDLTKLRDFARERYRLQKVFDKMFEDVSPKEARVLSFLNNVVESTFDMNGPLMAAKL